MSSRTQQPRRNARYTKRHGLLLFCAATLSLALLLYAAYTAITAFVSLYAALLALAIAVVCGIPAESAV
ncbi:hypothetical protein ACIBEJ_00885 [Nonomuraea sp. NPDC050790]|uniref:hypothetical protein n=1 Tax=Nonomuraea sp. NPDC050790 TaxID=3364371 RepID=UPI00378FE446